jgi:hypothetical protein
MEVSSIHCIDTILLNFADIEGCSASEVLSVITFSY